MNATTGPDPAPGTPAPPPAVAIRRGDYHDFIDVVQLLSIGLADSALSHWALPTLRDRHRVWWAHLTDVVMAGLRYGYVDIVDRGAAVAVWQPHLHPTPANDEHAATTATVSPVHHLRALHHGIVMAHPAPPHTDLVHLAVHPDWHDRGLPDALLQHRLNLLDQTTTLTVAHAEPASPLSRTLHHFGYTTDPPTGRLASLPLRLLTRPRRPIHAPTHPETALPHNEAPLADGPFNWRVLL